VCTQALGIAAVKAVVCIVGITAGGRLLIRPLYKKISGLANAEIFAATTLLVVLGTSFMTQLAGAACSDWVWLAGDGCGLQELTRIGSMQGWWLAGVKACRRVVLAGCSQPMRTMPAEDWLHPAACCVTVHCASLALLTLAAISRQLDSMLTSFRLCVSWWLCCGAGLSLALGAFLAGLLLAETEYALQVESDIAPYKGLLMGLFFMTVGESAHCQLSCCHYRCCTRTDWSHSHWAVHWALFVEMSLVSACRAVVCCAM
jgi:hypothetical protein